MNKFVIAALLGVLSFNEVRATQSKDVQDILNMTDDQLLALADDDESSDSSDANLLQDNSDDESDSDDTDSSSSDGDTDEELEKVTPTQLKAAREKLQKAKVSQATQMKLVQTAKQAAREAIDKADAAERDARNAQRKLNWKRDDVRTHIGRAIIQEQWGIRDARDDVNKAKERVEDDKDDIRSRTRYGHQKKAPPVKAAPKSAAAVEAKGAEDAAKTAGKPAAAAEGAKPAQ